MLTLVIMIVGSNRIMCRSSTSRMAEWSFLYIGIRFLGSETPKRRNLIIIIWLAIITSTHLVQNGQGVCTRPQPRVHWEARSLGRRDCPWIAEQPGPRTEQSDPESAVHCRRGSACMHDQVKYNWEMLFCFDSNSSYHDFPTASEK